MLDTMFQHLGTIQCALFMCHDLCALYLIKESTPIYLLADACFVFHNQLCDYFLK